MSLEFKVELIHVFPGCGKSTPFQTSDGSNITNISNEYIFDTNAHCCSVGKTFIIKIDLEQFHDEVVLSPGSEGQSAFDGKLTQFSQNTDKIEKWALDIVPEGMEAINVFVVVNRVASVVPKYLKLVSIVHPENYNEETLSKIDRMNLLDHFTVEEMNGWIERDRVMYIVKFYGVKPSIITVIKGNIFLNHIIIEQHVDATDADGNASDDVDNSDVPTIDSRKFIAVELCKTFNLEIELIYSSDISPDRSNVIRLSSISKIRGPNGKEIMPVKLRNKMKNQSLTNKDISEIMTNVENYYSALLVPNTDAYCSSAFCFFIILDGINLNKFSNKVLRIGNSQRLSSKYDVKSAEEYRISYIRNAHYIDSSDISITDQSLDYIIRSSSVRTKLTNDLRFTDSSEPLQDNDSDSDSDDPDGGRDINDEVVKENKPKKNFTIKFITCESDKECQLLNQISDFFIDGQSIIGAEFDNNITFISESFDKKEATIDILDKYIESSFDINDHTIFIVYSVRWWIEYGIDADLALGLSNEGNLEGHPLPIIIYQKDSDISESSINNVIQNDIKKVVVIGDNEDEKDNEENTDNIQKDKTVFINNSNSWLTTFCSVESVIIGDKEKLTGLSINCVSSFYDSIDMSSNINFDNKITIARMYKKITVMLFENKNKNGYTNSVQLRSDFVDICDRIDNSIIEFSSTYTFNKDSRLRKADDSNMIVDSSFDKSLASSTFSDDEKKSQTYSIIGKFLPFIQEVIITTKNIHPRFDSRNFALMEGAEHGSIGSGFKFVYFSILNSVVFYNAINEKKEDGKLNNFFIITNIDKDFFLRYVVNDTNGMLVKKKSGSPNMVINDKLKNKSLFDRQVFISNMFTNNPINSKNNQYIGRKQNTSVPTVNRSEIEHNVLGNNTLVFAFILNNVSYIIADTRTSSGSFINSDANTGKIQTRQTANGEIFSFGSAGSVADIQFTARVIDDIIADQGEEWIFSEFIDHVCDFVYHMQKNDNYLNIELLFMYKDNIIEVFGDGANLNYTSTGYHCIGSGMLFTLPAINMLFNEGHNKVTIDKIVSIFLTASKFDAGISTTYIINKVGELTVQLLSYDSAPVDNFVPDLLGSQKKFSNKKETENE